jgi:hypothetical protein
MHRGKVESTFAESIGYDHESRVLEIKTHPSRNAAGHIYQMKGVSPHTFAAFVTAHSIGAYYNRFIKAKFETVEVFEQHTPEEDLSGNLGMGSLTFSDEAIDKLANATVDAMARRFSFRS